jgi:predicted phosphodiesterase
LTRSTVVLCGNIREMPRVAALYDIHGNLPALEAVLGAVRRAGVDQVVIGGDVVPGPMPRETLACLRALQTPTSFIRGNGDRCVLEMMHGRVPVGLPPAVQETIRWVAEQLDDDDAAAFASWPDTLRTEAAPNVLFCHATPRSDSEIFTSRTDEARVRRAFAGIDASLVICGHTHMQFDRMIGSRRVVNAGSVGMPYGAPGGCWLLLGPEVQLQRTHYDLAAASARLRACGYPQAEQFVEEDLLHPRSEQEMLELFARAELR